MDVEGKGATGVNVNAVTVDVDGKGDVVAEVVALDVVGKGTARGDVNAVVVVVVGVGAVDDMTASD